MAKPTLQQSAHAALAAKKPLTPEQENALLEIPTFLRVGHPDRIAIAGPTPAPRMVDAKQRYIMRPLSDYINTTDNSPLARRTDEWRDERAYVVCAAIAEGCDTFYQIRNHLMGVYTREEIKSGLRRAAEQHWMIQRGRRYFIDETKARRAIMQGKFDFDRQKVETALQEMGYNVDVRAETLKALDMLEDAEKCRTFVAKAQGEDTAKSTAPIDMERYRKRAERLIRAYTNTPADGDNTPETEGESTTGGGEAATPSNAKETKTMAAKTKKAAKAATKKATTKKGGPQKAGVISAIIDTLKHAGGLSKKGYTVAQIAETLKKKFPDRKLEGMTTTVKVQLSRLPKEGKANIKSAKPEGQKEKLYWI